MDRQLPASVREIADVIGESQALRLVNGLPQTKSAGHPWPRPSLYVPRQLAPGHRLVRILGAEDAERLSRAFGGEVMHLAACRSVERAKKREAVARDIAGGMPRKEAVRVHGISLRTVERIAAGIPNRRQVA